MTTQETKNHRPWLSSVAWTVVVLIGTVIALKSSATAREVASETALTVFQILTAPFILETMLAVLGLCAVLVINHYRQQKEGDGWVYLQRQEPATGAAPETADPPHRHDAVVWHDKPHAFDEAATEFGVVEGYLDLGLADDALRELAALPESLRLSEQADDLLVRALAMSGKLPDAACAFEQCEKNHPRRSQQLAGTALSVALWLGDNHKAGAKIDEWLQRSIRLDARALEKLPDGHVLRLRAGK